MTSKNMVFIARSLDGYIADRKGGLDWLNLVPNPEHRDLGYDRFMKGIDAIVLGRKTFDTVCSFDIEWPYKQPVFILSGTLESLPAGYEHKAELLSGPLTGILAHIHKKGHTRLYIDGGRTVQNFLKEDLIDELIITNIPILLGGGIPLFGELPEALEFELVESVTYLDALVQDHYRRKRN